MLRVLNITAPDINNGNGVRVTLWVSGCSHHCKGCHNQWTWNYNQGKPLADNIEEIEKALDNWLSKDYIEGITFSGGDPLDQDELGLYQLLELINWIRDTYPTKTIWVYTGYEYDELIDKTKLDQISLARKSILKNIDVLVDGPYKEELRDIAHCPFRGSTNQRIIKLK